MTIHMQRGDHSFLYQQFGISWVVVFVVERDFSGTGMWEFSQKAPPPKLQMTTLLLRVYAVLKVLYLPEHVHLALLPD